MRCLLRRTTSSGKTGFARRRISGFVAFALLVLWPTASLSVAVAVAAEAAAQPAAPSGADMVIELISPACTGGPQILLGEIAMIHVADEELRAELMQVEVAPAPLPGGTRKVNIGQIQVRMRQRKIDPARFTFLGPGETIVSTASLRIQASELERAAMEALIAKSDYALSVGDLSVIRNDAPQGILVSTGRVSLDPKIVPAGSESASSRVDVRVVLDGATVRTIPIWLKIIAPPVVHKDSSVVLAVDTAGISISVPAVALEDGRVGQKIRVRNSVSGVEVTARVIDSGTVRAILDTLGGQQR